MSQQTGSLNYDALMEVVRRRRSVRAFEHGRAVGREVLEKIVDCGRWAPSGANTQMWDFIVVDDPEIKKRVFDVFMRQSQRLIDHAKGFPAVKKSYMAHTVAIIAMLLCFPAVKKSYMAHTVAIIVVVGDPRWKDSFPQGTSPDFVK